jgi:hypothetical protein
MMQNEQFQIKSKTGGSRPARRLTFYNAKKVSKKAGSCGGHFFREWSVFCSAAQVNEYISATWHRKPIPAFLNPLNEKVGMFRMTCNENLD